jgi:thioredoxin reductase (NADPH)
LLWTHNPITNHLGVSTANGREMRDMFVRQLGNREFSLVTGTRVVQVDVDAKTACLEDGRTFEAEFLVLATGVSRRRLGIPGESEFAGKGVLESGVKAKAEVAGKRVVIVGGGDAAVENALILSEAAARVFLLHRRDEFTAQRQFLEALKSRSNVEVIVPAHVNSILGDEAVRTVEFTDATGEKISLQADNVLLRVGVNPNSDLFKSQVDTDSRGFVLIGSECETSVAGVFAAGDLTAPLSPTISSAVGHGATAAKVIASRLFSKQ